MKAMKTQNSWRITSLILITILLNSLTGAIGLVTGVVLAPTLRGILPQVANASAVQSPEVPTP